MLRKSIVAIKEINKGDIFSENNVGVKRPGGGLSPTKWFDILGKSSKKRYRKDDFI